MINNILIIEEILDGECVYFKVDYPFTTLDSITCGISDLINKPARLKTKYICFHNFFDKLTIKLSQNKKINKTVNIYILKSALENNIVDVEPKKLDYENPYLIVKLLDKNCLYIPLTHNNLQTLKNILDDDMYSSLLLEIKLKDLKIN